MFDEKTISSQRIFSGKLLKVRVDQVVLPDGKESSREIVEHPGAAAVVALDENDNVYLVRQYRKPVEKDLLEIPAGTRDNGEDPLDCIQRELSEEVGFRAGKLTQLAVLCTTPGFCTEVIHIFLATELSPHRGEQDSDEFLTVEKYPFVEAVKMVHQGQITDAKTVAGLLLAAGRLNVNIE